MSNQGDTTQGESRDKAQLPLLAKLVGVTVLMFGFGFALVPLYEVVCEITGFNGRSEGLQLVSQVNEMPDESRTVRVEFTTSLNANMPWQFGSERNTIDVHPGKLYTVEFWAENEAGRDMVGQARPSVAPWNAAKYLRKTECFCFNEQPMAAGERKQMPMRFMIDPELPAHVDTVTLSYTFFELENVDYADVAGDVAQAAGGENAAAYQTGS